MSSIRGKNGVPVLIFAPICRAVYGEERFKMKESEGQETESGTASHKASVSRCDVGHTVCAQDSGQPHYIPGAENPGS